MNNLGSAYFNVGDHEKAIESYEELLVYYPWFSDAIANLAVSYIKVERFDDAINCYEKGIKVDAGYAEIYDNLATVYREKKDYTKSENFYNFGKISKVVVHHKLETGWVNK